VEHDFESGIAFVAASGNLDALGAIRLRRAVRRVFAEHPQAVVIDLDGAALVAPRALESAVALRGERTFVVLDARPLDPRVHPDRRRAVSAALSAAQPPLRARAYLPPGVNAPGAARGVVRLACRRWGLDGVSTHAELVVSELVTNAVTHAGSELEVVLALDGGDLNLFVRDHGRDLPQLPASRVGVRAGRRLGGLGLMLVEDLAAAWGTTFRAHGKTVWARFRLAAGAGWQTSHQ
jgi:anti-sigma regulatory factor (Ser/Thr protein kinase)